MIKAVLFIAFFSILKTSICAPIKEVSDCTEANSKLCFMVT